MVCTRHHGGHVGGQEQKHIPPLGTELHFHVNSSRKKNSFVLTEHSWPPCHMVANQNKYFNFFGMLQNAVLPIFFWHFINESFAALFTGSSDRSDLVVPFFSSLQFHQYLLDHYSLSGGQQGYRNIPKSPRAYIFQRPF